MAFEVFISYSSKDKTTADATCASLEAAGIRCWMAPRDILPGSEYGAAIVDALDRCRVVVLVFSSSANSSPQIHREIERAVSRGVPIIPLRIEETMPTESMAYFMESVHWLDAMNPPFELHLQRLGDSLKVLLQMNSDAVAPQRLTPSGRPLLKEATGFNPQLAADSATRPANRATSGERRLVNVAIRTSAIIAIVLLVTLGAICVAAAIGLLRKSDEAGTIMGAIMALLSFALSFLIYKFGVRRAAILRK